MSRPSQPDRHRTVDELQLISTTDLIAYGVNLDGIELAIGRKPTPPRVTRRQVRSVIHAIDTARTPATHPPFLARIGDDIQDVLRRYLATGDADPTELRAIEDVLRATSEWRLREHGGDPFEIERGATFTLIRRLREHAIRSQLANSSAPQGATLDFPSAAQRGRLPAVPNETPAQRRKRIIGTNITRFREAAGLSKNELARRLGVDRGSLIRWENGTWEPSPDHLEGLADHLEVAVFEFYREELAA